MANNKTGLNYYSIDTDRYMDIRIKRLKKDHGCRGLAVYDYLLCEVYRVRGCFSVWDESTAFDVAEYFGLTESNVSEIVKYCGVVGLFDKELLSRGIVTSASIQRRYLEMCSRARRKEAIIPEEFRILTEESPKMRSDAVSLPQSKVKESKVNISTSPVARAREGENLEFTKNDGITACAQEVDGKSEYLTPEKSCAKKVPPAPLPDGTYEYIPTTAIADYLIGEEGWIESLCMNKHLDRAYVEQKICEFATECQNNGETAKDKRDCKRHFNNWLRKNQQIQRNVNYERSAKNQPPNPDELARAVAEGISRAHTRQEWE